MPAVKSRTRPDRRAKTARMEHRMEPAIKAEIQRAASLLGLEESSFVTSAALAEARQVLAAREQTLLDREDRDLFLAALDAPPVPTAALRQAFALYQQTVRTGD